MSTFKKLASDTAIYGISTILSRMLNYLTVPIYTAFFLPSEVGVIGLLYSYSAFFVIIYTYGMETALFRYSNKHPEDKQKIFNNNLSSVLLTSLGFSALLVLFAKPLISFIGFPDKVQFVYYFAAIYAMDAVMSIPFAKLRLDKQPKRFAILKTMNIVMFLALNLFFIVFCRKVYQGEWFVGLQEFVASWYSLEMGPEYVVISNLIASGFTMLFLLGLFKGFKLSFSHYNKQMLKYGFPLVFNGIAGIAIAQLPVIMLNSWLPDNYYEGLTKLDIVGIYSTCAKLAIFMNLGVMAFRYASEPFFFAKAKDKDSPVVFGKVMHYFVIITSIVYIGIVANLDILGDLFLKQEIFKKGLSAVPLLLLSNLFIGIYYNLSIWFKLTDRTHYGTVISMSAMMIMIVLNILLIPKMGFMGSAWTTLFVNLAMVTINYWLGQKFYPIKYNVKSILAYILSAILFSYLLGKVDTSIEIWDKIIQITLIIIYIAGIYLIEKKSLKSISK